jgi:hypothetical protein
MRHYRALFAELLQTDADQTMARDSDVRSDDKVAR